MADFDLDAMEALYEEEKVLVEDFEWEQLSREDRYTGSAQVRTKNSDEILKVRGEKWGPKHSFALLYHNTSIRVWDYNDHHPGIDGGHKHKYRESGYVDFEPYAVNDVSTSDVNQGLIDFLDECRVDHEAATIEEITELSHYE